MKKFIRTLYQSFYSREFYYDVAHKWSGTGIGVLGWLSLVGTIILCVITFIAINAMNTGYSKFKEELLTQIPQANFENGELSIDRPTPYYIKYQDEDYETGQPVTQNIALIDTSVEASKKDIGQIISQMNAEGIKFYANKYNIVVIKEEGEYKLYDMRQEKQKVSFGKAEVASWVRMMEIIVLPFIAVFMFLFVWVYKIIQMLVYSLVAKLVESFIKSGVDYPTLQRISACAIFPATIIGAVLLLVGLDLPLFFSFIITSILIIFGLKSAKTPS